jgi:putative ABC transport system substrate-binding protein
MRHQKYFQKRKMKNRILYIGAVSIILFLCGCGAKPKVYHVGVLACLDYFAPLPDGFKEGMAKLGYVENENIVYDIHKTEGEVEEEQKRILEKFVSDKVDLIVVAPTGAALKAKAVAMKSGVPVVFAAAFTEGNDLIESIPQPGGNITGVRWPSSPELAVKNLEMLHQIMPQVKRVWVSYQKDYTTIQIQIDALRSAAESSGIILIEVPLRNVEDIRTDLNARDKSGNITMEVIQTINEPLAVSGEGFSIITGFTFRHKIPVIGPISDMTLFSLAPEPYKSGRQSAYLADKVLKGAPAGTIPVLTLENTLKINYKAIQKMGWRINENMLSQADEIIR